LEIVEGVHQLRVPMPSNAVMSGKRAYTLVYLVEDSSGWVLIDSGWNYEEGWSALKTQLSEVVPNLHDIKTLIVTHFHPDHLGLAGHVKQATGANLVMHQNDAPDMRKNNLDIAISPNMNQNQAWLVRCGATAEEARQSQPPNRGQDNLITNHVIQTPIYKLPESKSLYTIWTPGHSPGHLCIYDYQRKLLFSGDHILPTISPNIGLFPFSTSDPLADYQESLLRTKELDVTVVLPAHEDQFTNLSSRVDELLAHHEARLTEVIQVINEKSYTGFQVAALLTWNSKPWEKMEGLTRFLALGETMSHIRHLVNKEIIREGEWDGVAYYSRS
jgi:glyoxylase-like metal-dependent hydrolase (beta-lactamase superfamily II)